MIISFYGEGCFKIQSGDFTILTDPFESQIGLTPPRFKADLVIKTITPFPVPKSTPEANHLIIGAGEYNIKDVNVVGFALKKESSDKFLKSIYIVKIEGLKLCLLGHISEMPESEIMEYLEEIDILFIPAGGKPFIDQESAIKLIKQIEPKIVVPTFFKTPGLKRQSADLKAFLEDFDHSQKNSRPQEKLTIKKKDLTAIKKTELAILSI